MQGGAKIIVGLAVFVVLATGPFWLPAATGGGAKPPVLVIPPGLQQCVESKEFMLSNHMDLLNTWRDSVVRQNVRDYKATDGRVYKMSLTGTCLSCHTNKSEFCDRCHNYVSVAPDCWKCHVVPAEAVR
ncbi:MAG: sulfate reduction electron transfer complex DsrMKJOP subunit DsrJ [Planctomycetota bacterium]